VKQQFDLTWWFLPQASQQLLDPERSWACRLGLVLAVSLLVATANPMACAEDLPILVDTPTTNTYIPAVPLVPGLWQKPYYPQQRQQPLTTDSIPANTIPPVPMAMPAVESPDSSTISSTQGERPLAEDLAAKYGARQEPQTSTTSSAMPEIHTLSPSLGPVTNRPAAAKTTLPVSNNRTDTSVYEKTLSWPYDAASPEAMRQQEAEGRQAQLNAMRAQQQAEAQAKAALEAAQRAIELAAKRKAEQAALEARQASAQERAAAIKQQQAAEAARQAAINQQRQTERLAAQKAAEARAQEAANARALARAKAKAIAAERAQARAVAAQEAAEKAKTAREAKARLLAEQQATEKAQAEARAAEQVKARAVAQAKFEAERKAHQAALAAKREAATQAKQVTQQTPQAKPTRVVKAAAAQATPPEETKPSTEANTPPKEAPQEAYNRGVELFNYAQLQLQNGNYNGHLQQLNLAREAFENALKGDPSLVEAQSNIGYVYLTQKDYPKAIKAFDKALLLNDKHLSSLNGLATTYALRNKLAVALTYYQRLTELAPGNDQFWFNQGSILQRMDQPEDAKAAYDEALKINPKNQRAWFNIGTLYENQGAAEQALTAYQKVKSIDLSNPIGLEALNRIKRIQTEAAQKQAADNISSAAKPDVIKPIDTVTK
jgi:lipoprotein NlpI